MFRWAGRCTLFRASNPATCKSHFLRDLGVRELFLGLRLVGCFYKKNLYSRIIVQSRPQTRI